MKKTRPTRIGIDARMWNETGVGRYIRSIVQELAKLDTETDYIVFLLPTDFETVHLPSNFKKISVAIRWHSLAEQLTLPVIFMKEHLDLLWVPHFNVPFFYPKKFLVTIHDLTPLRVHTGKVSTLPYPIFLLKYFAAWLIFANSAIRSKKIFTVSEFVKNDITKTFHVPPNKVCVTYNAVGENFYRRSEQEIQVVLAKYGVKSPYLLYVGNAQPHKNLESFIEAFKLIAVEQTNLYLALGGKKTYFYKRMQTNLANQSIESKVLLLDFIQDEDLPALYSGAEAFVYPSVYEGFGIQLLEAMACGTKVICSNVTSLPEIARRVAFYFDPLDIADMATKSLVALKDNAEEKIAQGILRSKEFSWKKSAQKIYETLKTYGSYKATSSSFR